MSALAAVIASALIVVGVAFVFWPAALIAAGVLLGVDALFEIRGET